MSTLLVRFDGEIRLVDYEIPERQSFADVQQAVQDAVGHSGIVVIDVYEYEHEA